MTASEISSMNGLDQSAMNHDFVCEDCSSTAVCAGLLEKRTGFCCCGCLRAFHFKCKGLTTYKNGLLPNAVLSFFDCNSVKVEIEKVLFCDDCEPKDLSTNLESVFAGTQQEAELDQDISKRKVEVYAIDKEARGTLEKMQEANEEMKAKLDFLVNFFVPPDPPTVKPDIRGEVSVQSYAEKVTSGTSGLQSMVRTACAEAQRQVTETDRMKRTVIFDGVPEGRTEGEDANHLMKALGIPSFPIAEVHRLGFRKGARPRKLKIVCNSETDQRFLLGGQIQEVLHSSSFPLKDVYMNPSTSSEERRFLFLLRQRRNFLNRNLLPENSYFLHRGDGRLIKKTAGRPEWSWLDTNFDDWVAKFEEEHLRSRRNRQAPEQGRGNVRKSAGPLEEEHLGGSGSADKWTTVGHLGKPLRCSKPQGNV